MFCDNQNCHTYSQHLQQPTFTITDEGTTVSPTPQRTYFTTPSNSPLWRRQNVQGEAPQEDDQSDDGDQVVPDPVDRAPCFTREDFRLVRLRSNLELLVSTVNQVEAQVKSIKVLTLLITQAMRHFHPSLDPRGGTGL